MAFPPLGNSDHVVVSNFPSNSKKDPQFHRIADDYSRVDWDSSRDHLRDVPREHYCLLLLLTRKRFF